MPISYDHRQGILSGEVDVQLRTEKHCREKLGLSGKGDSIVISLIPDDEDYGTIYLYEVRWDSIVTVDDLGGIDQAKKTLLCEEDSPRYKHVLEFLCGYRSLVCLSIGAYGYRERERAEEEHPSPEINDLVNGPSKSVNGADEIDLLF